MIDKEAYGRSRDDVYEEMKKQHVFCRRYFYPLISQFPSYRGLESALPGKMPVAESVARKVLCLPCYSDLNFEDVARISRIIGELQRAR